MSDVPSLVVGFGVGRQWVNELDGLELAGPDDEGDQKSEDQNARDDRTDDGGCV